MGYFHIYIYIWAIFRYAGSVILSQPISPKSSLQAVHSSVVGTRYGVSFVRIWLIHSLPQSLQYRMDHHDIFCTPTIIAPKCLKDMYTRYLIFIRISYKIVHKQIIIESANCHQKQHTVNDMIHNATCKWCNITSSMSVFIVSRTDMALFQIENTIDFFFSLGLFSVSCCLLLNKLRLCLANHKAGYFSNLACDWLSIVWAYSEQETENGPRSQWVK